MVAHAALAVCDDRVTAAGIAQEAFAVALGSWPRVSQMVRPGAWVRRVAFSLALKARARQEEEGTDRARRTLPGGAATTDLATSIEDLPVKQRVAVVLHHLHDLSLTEVADTLGCAASTADVHLRRAHQSLAPLLAGAPVGPAVKKALRDEFLAVAEVLPSEPVEGIAWHRPTMLFITSPALGPTSLAPTVHAMVELGYDATLVDMRGIVDLPLPRWRAAVGRIAAAAYTRPGPVVLVGHGQAGPLLLPAADLRRVVGLILVDTALPPRSGEVPALPRGLVEALAADTVDSRLPPWETWWPQCALEFLVDDDGLRNRLRSELPRLPVAYGKEVVPIGRRQRTLPQGYLRLSLERESEATFAGMRGMAVERLTGNHLVTATEPAAVAAKLAVLMDALEPAMI